MNRRTDSILRGRKRGKERERERKEEGHKGEGKIKWRLGDGWRGKEEGGD